MGVLKIKIKDNLADLKKFVQIYGKIFKALIHNNYLYVEYENDDNIYLAQESFPESIILENFPNSLLYNNIINEINKILVNMSNRISKRDLTQINKKLDLILDLIKDIEFLSVDRDKISKNINIILNNKILQSSINQSNLKNLENIIDNFNDHHINISIPDTLMHKYTDFFNDGRDNYGVSSKYTSDEYTNQVGLLDPQYYALPNLPNIIYDSNKMDELYLNKLSNDIKKIKFVPTSQINQKLSELQSHTCANLTDFISMEDISENEFINFGWIYIQNYNNESGFCFDKQELIKFMFDHKVFGTYPNRNKIYYQLIYPNVYVDVGGLEAIPTSKILKLVLIGSDNVGTYFGVGTTHGVKHNIYTLVPIQYKK